MGVCVEFNSVLALRCTNSPKFQAEECITRYLAPNVVSRFKKKGYRVFPLEKDILLLETEGNGNFTRKVAIIKILEVTVNTGDGTINTTGLYEIVKAFPSNEQTVTKIETEVCSE